MADFAQQNESFALEVLMFFEVIRGARFFCTEAGPRGPGFSRWGFFKD